MKKAYNEGKYDLGIAQRFKTFRKKYISKNGYDAAKELGLSQTTISRFERGEYRMNADLIKLLVKNYKLNRDWLIDNTGEPLMTDAQSKGTIVDINNLKDANDALTNEVMIMNKNLAKLWDIVEQQGAAIDYLQKKILELTK